MKFRVFVVEDSSSALAAVRALVAALPDAEIVGIAPSEPQAREWLRQHAGEWDLALVDLVLEQGSGIGVIRAARESSSRASIIVLTAYATPGMRQHSLRLGADAAFDKSELSAVREWILASRSRPPP